MKQILRIAMALTLLGGTAAIAQSNFPNRNDQGRNDRGRTQQDHNNSDARRNSPRFSRGERLPDQYRNNRQYVVSDWQQRHLRKPPRGYHWVRDDNNNYYLAAITTGLILDLMLNSR